MNKANKIATKFGFVVALIILPFGIAISSPPLIIIGALLLFIWWKERKKAKVKSSEGVHVTPPGPTPSSNVIVVDSKALMNFNVVGREYNGRQKNYKEWVADETFSYETDEMYEGYTNKELLDDAYNFGIDKVYQFDLSGYDDIEFILEDDNPRDAEAVKVEHEVWGDLGYVPAEDARKMRKMLAEHSVSVEWKIFGGKYKYYDEEEHKIRTKTEPFGVNLRVFQD